jgi:hypothetical protein
MYMLNDKDTTRHFNASELLLLQQLGLLKLSGLALRS